MSGDHRAVLAGYQALGAIAPDADLDEFLREIPMNRPVVDPANANADQMIVEMRRVTKALVKHGARLPKELVLFMKDFMFIDGAIGTLAPDLDVLGEMFFVSQYFVRQHGAQIASEIGLDPGGLALDPASWASSMGVPGDRPTLTHDEIQRQRREMRTMIAGRRRRR